MSSGLSPRCACSTGCQSVPPPIAAVVGVPVQSVAEMRSKGNQTSLPLTLTGGQPVRACRPPSALKDYECYPSSALKEFDFNTLWGETIWRRERARQWLGPPSKGSEGDKLNTLHTTIWKVERGTEVRRGKLRGGWMRRIIYFISFFI